MFDITDKDLIKRIINQRDDSEIIIPLYVKIYNETYPILEIDSITHYSPNSFKVGFGSANSMFMKNSFPTHLTHQYYAVTSFSEFDESSSCNIGYIVFESSFDDENNEISDQINKFVNILSEHISENAKRHREKILSEFQ
ncbi:MAG: hypothetical protein IKA36_01750 [Clostridia bacterium]|nr:hypothetical protein [Clostridia bacterium]